jgi:signal peptidase I
MAAKRKFAEPIDWSAPAGPAQTARLGRREKRIVQNLGATLGAVAVGLALFFVFDTSTFVIPSAANAGTLEPGDHVLVINGSSVTRNELIVFHAPLEGSPLVIMRAVAVGGDRINQVGDKLYVNGKVASRPFLPTDTTHRVSEMVIPAGRVYVLGDNRANSLDSRFYGPVSKSDIVGHLVTCYWPISRVGDV